MRTATAFMTATMIFAGCVSTPTFAVPLRADLSQLNRSGVSGTALLELTGTSLSVSISATGLEPGRPHAQHIHGRFDGAGTPVDSVEPTISNDTDGDGFVEVGEGLASYGAIILPLTSGGGFPIAAADGSLAFFETYDLSDPAVFAPGFSMADLFPLDLRAIVLHGLSVASGIGAGTPGEVNGSGGYLPPLPVATGEITPIPAPSSLLLAAGLLPWVWERKGTGSRGRH